MSFIKKSFFIFVLILISLGITFFEMNAIEKRKEENYGELIIAKKDIFENTPITLDDLKSVKVLKENMTPLVFSHKENLLGKTLQVNLKKDEIISQSMLQEDTKRAKENNKKGESQTALKLPPEASLAWQMNIGDEVTVVFTSEKDEEYQKIGQVVVDGIYDHLTQEYAMPTYLLVSGAPEVIDTIVKSRHLGHLEIIKP